MSEPSPSARRVRRKRAPPPVSRRKIREWHSVIPFSFDPSRGGVILLGMVHTGPDANMYRDFGGNAQALVWGACEASRPGDASRPGETSRPGEASALVSKPSPQLTASRMAVRASNGLFGTVEEVRSSLISNFRIRVPGMGFVYILPLRPMYVPLLPSMFNSNRSVVRSHMRRPDEFDEATFMRRVDWIPVSELRRAIATGTGARANGASFVLCPVTLEALRYLFAQYEFDESKSMIVPKQPVRESSGPPTTRSGDESEAKRARAPDHAGAPVGAGAPPDDSPVGRTT